MFDNRSVPHPPYAMGFLKKWRVHMKDTWSLSNYKKKIQNERNLFETLAFKSTLHIVDKIQHSELSLHGIICFKQVRF